MIELLTDIIGRNLNGQTCHPYKYQSGPRAGSYVFTLTGNNSFDHTDELGLRRLVESGAFNKGGRIRMLPKESTSTGSASALNVISYKGKPLS